MPTTTKYIWDEDNLLAEADGSDTIHTVYTNEPQQYGNLISTRLPIAGSPTTVYHHFDAIGSTRQLTNAVGGTTDTMIYDAWGNVVSRTGTTSVYLLWIGMLGYYCDSEIGTNLVRERTYSPQVGRWTSVDRLWLTAGTNAFIAVKNNPQNRVDPTGLISAFASAFNYIAGRGEFTRILLTDTSVPSKLSVFFSPSWQPSAVWTSLPKPCRCKSVGFVQIVQSVSLYESIFGSIHHLFNNPANWLVDGGIPYPYSGMGGKNVIDPTITYPALNIQDDPDIGIGNSIYGWLSSNTFDAETCVVCLDARLPSKPIEMEVYGCVRWGWSFYTPQASSHSLYTRGSELRRYIAIGERSTFTSKRAQALTFSPLPTPGALPTDTWFKTVYLYLLLQSFNNISGRG